MRFHAILILAFLSGCSIFPGNLSKEVQRKNDFRLIEDDGRNAVWSVRDLTREEGRAWLGLVADERKRVEDFFATAAPGEISLWLVDTLPSRFAGDAFSERTDIYLRFERGLPTDNDRSIVTHEMTHVVMHTAFGMHRPFWFEEGLATYLEGEHQGFGAGRRDLLSGVSGLEKLDVSSLTLENVERVERPLAYRLSASAIELILEKHGNAAIRRLQREPAGRVFADGYFRVTGESLPALEQRWREEIRTVARLRALHR